MKSTSVFLVFCLSVMCASTAAIPKKPNVIIIPTDDPGAVDNNCLGSKDFITPNPDRLAKEELQCSPVSAVAPFGTPSWVEVSMPVLKKLEQENRKISWPGKTAGVAVDPATGHVFMIVPGQGIWKSQDQGSTFNRIDQGQVGGRCETSYSLQFDPSGKRLACFMLDGKCGITVDGGKTWASFTDLGRNWDYAAVDWSSHPVKNIIGARHETGGEVFLSHDAGKTWGKLFADPEFEKTGGLGIFGAKTLVYTMKGRGIQRSINSGKTWTQISDLEPWGRVVRIRNGTAYWLTRKGLLVSKDKGATWTRKGATVEASIGPLFNLKDEEHMAVAGLKGIFETRDEGASWTFVAKLPAKFDLPKPGWFSNLDWDPERGLYYSSRMGMATFKLKVGE